MKEKKNLLRYLVLMLAAAALFCGCGHNSGQITTYEELKEPGRILAVSTNSPESFLVMDEFSEADVRSYTDIFPAYQEVSNGKVDACFAQRREMELAMENGVSGVRLLDETYCVNTIVAGLSRKSRIPDLQEKINEFLQELRADGTLDDMFRRWVTEGNYTMPDIAEAKNPEYTLTIATTGTVEPYSFYSGTVLTGYDVELAMRFAAWLNAGLKFKIYDWSGLLSAVQAGDADCIMSNLYYRAEYSEAMDFSDPLFSVEVSAMVRDTGEAEEVRDSYSLDQLDGKNIGIITGSIFAPFVSERLPNATISYFNGVSDLIAALKSKKIDSFPYDETSLKVIMQKEDHLDYLGEYLDEVEVAAVFAKTSEGEALRDEFNEWLIPLRESGELAQIRDKWTNGPQESRTTVDYEALPAEKGTLTVATEGSAEPFNYISDGKVSGYEVDLISRFCAEKGYALEFDIINFDGILMAVKLGQVDMAMSGFAVTEERKESVLFSEPYSHSGSVMAVLKEAGSTSFWESVISSFEKTFIREDRWKLFVSGIGTTLLITVLPVLFGTLLGFGVFMICRKGNKVANAVTRFCIWLVQGMPVVVLLMILYYVVFGSVKIPGSVVAIIGFTLIFGAGVYGMLKTGTSAVDYGQTEAAYSLGYTDRQAFFKVVLPQTMPIIMPSFKGDIVALIKATAVVGYVAVMDLTKMGDIVRSRTYEAFFPLIAVAVIYFILAGLLKFIVSRIEPCFNPKRRKREDILKGVEQQ